MTADHVRLEPFDLRWAETVLSWIETPDELRFWGARTDFPLQDVTVFAEWHADPEVNPYVLLVHNEPVAYGELWLDEVAGTAEFGRIVVSPAHRRQSFAHQLIELLDCRARAAGYHETWVRVFPDNIPAISCYQAAGFERADSAQQTVFNETQRISFLWMFRRNELTSD